MKLLSFFLDCLFPPFCCGCSRFGSYLCPACCQAIEFLPGPIKLDLSEPYLDSLVASAYMVEPLSSLIYELKYQSVKGISQWCGQLLYTTTEIPCVDVITSVPLHPRRQRFRGFNQAEEIAVEVARLSQIPYQALLRRNKHTQNQASIASRTTRLSHLKDCFEAINQDCRFSSVLIIDDVTTTGTTLNECAKILKYHGIKTVHGLVVAHGN